MPIGNRAEIDLNLTCANRAAHTKPLMMRRQCLAVVKLEWIKWTDRRRLRMEMDHQAVLLLCRVRLLRTSANSACPVTLETTVLVTSAIKQMEVHGQIQVPIRMTAISKLQHRYDQV